MPPAPGPLACPSVRLTPVRHATLRLETGAHVLWWTRCWTRPLFCHPEDVDDLGRLGLDLRPLPASEPAAWEGLTMHRTGAATAARRR